MPSPTNLNNKFKNQFRSQQQRSTNNIKTPRLQYHQHQIDDQQNGRLTTFTSLMIDPINNRPPEKRFDQARKS